LIARQTTLEKAGLEPHKRRVQLSRNRGIEYLYICGLGINNILLAEHLSRDQQTAGCLLVLDSQKYRFAAEERDIGAICILCRLLPPVRSQPYQDINVIVTLLQEYIPEIADGKIEVVYVTRTPSIKSKVVVNSLVPGLDALAVCSDATKLRAMQFALAGESIEFLRLYDDQRSFVVAALAPLRADQVAECVVDLTNKTATARVLNQQARNAALGNDNFNLALAEQLTGYRITVEVVGDAPPGNPK
jgi:transcription antitermination factor NusA-like protein